MIAANELPPKQAALWRSESGFFCLASQRGRASEEKSQIWSENLHKVAIYLFDVASRDKQKRYGFILRGNPAITNSASFYQLDVVDMTTMNLTNPNEERYEQKVIQNYAMPMVRGSLFEHMFPRDKGKQLNQSNQHWDRQLFSGIEFVTKQIKNPEQTAYARSHDN